MRIFSSSTFLNLSIPIALKFDFQVIGEVIVAFLPLPVSHVPVVVFFYFSISIVLSNTFLFGIFIHLSLVIYFLTFSRLLVVMFVVFGELEEVIH